MELGITKGDWKCSEIMNFSDTLVSYIGSEDKPIAQLRGCETGQEDEAQANAQLIADAGTTANKCGLLPSEILEQLVECKEALQSIISEDYDFGVSIHDMSQATLSKAMQTINNTLNK